MVEILAKIQEYVPTVSKDEVKTIPGTDDTVTVKKDEFHALLIGGDQLTAARIRGSQTITSNSERGIDRLEGVTAVVEDWHAKQCLFRVCFTV